MRSFQLHELPEDADDVRFLRGIVVGSAISLALFGIFLLGLGGLAWLWGP